MCLPWKSTEPDIDNIKEVFKITITGWGKITNNNKESLDALIDHSVLSRTLRKVELPLTITGTKSHENCPKCNSTIQFCAGGLKGKQEI